MKNWQKYSLPIENDQFSPVMDRGYPLADLVEAHRYVETGRKWGNVVVI